MNNPIDIYIALRIAKERGESRRTLPSFFCLTTTSIIIEGLLLRTNDSSGYGQQ